MRYLRRLLVTSLILAGGLATSCSKKPETMTNLIYKDTAEARPTLPMPSKGQMPSESKGTTSPVADKKPRPSEPDRLQAPP
jgi:hypothetical protein